MNQWKINARARHFKLNFNSSIFPQFINCSAGFEITIPNICQPPQKYNNTVHSTGHDQFFIGSDLWLKLLLVCIEVWMAPNSTNLRYVGKWYNTDQIANCTSIPLQKDNIQLPYYLRYHQGIGSKMLCIDADISSLHIKFAILTL